MASGKLILPPKERKRTVLGEAQVIAEVVGHLRSLAQVARAEGLDFDALVRTAKGER